MPLWPTRGSKPWDADLKAYIDSLASSLTIDSVRAQIAADIAATGSAIGSALTTRVRALVSSDVGSSGTSIYGAVSNRISALVTAAVSDPATPIGGAVTSRIDGRVSSGISSPGSVIGTALTARVGALIDSALSGIGATNSYLFVKASADLSTSSTSGVVVPGMSITTPSVPSGSIYCVRTSCDVETASIVGVLELFVDGVAQGQQIVTNANGRYRYAAEWQITTSGTSTHTFEIRGRCAAGTPMVVRQFSSLSVERKA